MARGQVRTVPSGSNLLITTETHEEKSSMAVLNPNDGFLYIKMNGPAGPTPSQWDWKLPSQSYGLFPGPWTSIGVYYVDQSGSNRGADINIYDSDQKLYLPSIIAIGRAVALAGSALDVSQGTIPANPPASTIRLWADGNGDLHTLSSTGVDQIVVDSATALGGDLEGTVPNGRVTLQNQVGFISALGSTGTKRPLLQVNSLDQVIFWEQTTAPFRWVTPGAGAELLRLDNNGTLSVAYTLNVAGDIYGNNGNLYLSSSGTNPIRISNWGAAQLRVWGALVTDTSIAIGPDYLLQFQVNGYSWKGVVNQAVVRTDGSIITNGGSVYFNDAGYATNTYRLSWDGTYLHSTMPIRSSQSIYNQGGIYYAGATNQSAFSIWNPGEFKITSAPGNLYVAGLVNALGNPCYGLGTYVNTASSQTVKTKIIELDSVESLNLILDKAMRPVSFEYIDPQIRQKYHDPKEAEPNPNAPDVIWTDRKLGFIAEEVSNVVPEATGKIEGTDLGFGLAAEMLIPILWSAVRELDGRIKRLEQPAVTA